MGYTKVTTEIFSCDCGWVGPDPIERHDDIPSGCVGKVERGSRGGVKSTVFCCRLCHKPIKASPIRSLLEVDSVKATTSNGTD